MNPKRWLEYGWARLARRPWGAWLDRAERAVSLEGAERLSANFPLLWGADLANSEKLLHNSRVVAKRRARGEPRLVHWLVPDFSQGSGGHRTVMRFVDHLQAQGVENHIFVMPQSAHGEDLSSFVARHFGETGAQFHPTPQGLGGTDIFFATSWETAYAGFELKEPLFKAYFIQDDETLFYPAGSFRLFAENSYKMGYHGCCASPWLARLARERGMEATAFTLGHDPSEFYPEPGVEREREAVAVYLRPGTERRGLELLLGALTLLQDKRPATRIKLFGSHDLLERRLPFEAESLGILDTQGMRRLFSEVELLLLCSFTNYSLLPQEALACGCRVLDLDTECNREVFGPTSPVSLAPAFPLGLALQAKEILDFPDGRRAFEEQAALWLGDKSWEEVFIGLWAAINKAWEDTD